MERSRLTLQHLCLCNMSFTSALKYAPIDEVKNNAVRKLLPILIRGIGYAEVAEMETFGNALRLLSTISVVLFTSVSEITHLVRFGQAQDECTRGVNLDPSPFPQLILC
jgi:hypothetical protein